jgi:two-component system response regulator HydG
MPDKKSCTSTSTCWPVVHLLGRRGDQLNRLEPHPTPTSPIIKFGELIGGSEPMRRMYEIIAVAAPTSASVILSGESGTGKELVAQALHTLSPRVTAPFIALNCSAIPSTLLESEMFGYEKGAFTGAARTKPGCFELADQGTLFLDEIVEMSPDLQIKLLRVLEHGRFRRVGGLCELKVNVRIVAASNMDFRTAVEIGKLREDLYYRLNVFSLHLPPLRERPQDIRLLCDHFIAEFNLLNHKKIRGIEKGLQRHFLLYQWPGNVRELRNTLERAVIVSQGPLITWADLPQELEMAWRSGKAAKANHQLTIDVNQSWEQIESMVLRRVVEICGGNKSEAARRLGLSVKTLHNKLP